MLVAEPDAIAIPATVALREIFIVEGGTMEGLMNIAHQMNHPTQGQRSLFHGKGGVVQLFALPREFGEERPLGWSG